MPGQGRSLSIGIQAHGRCRVRFSVPSRSVHVNPYARFARHLLLAIILASGTSGHIAVSVAHQLPFWRLQLHVKRRQDRAPMALPLDTVVIM